MLARGTFVATNRENPKRMDLLAEANAILGYKPEVLNHAILDRMQGECEIEAALGRLKIRPFSQESVRAYKARMIHKTEKMGSNEFVLQMHSEKGENFIWPLGIASGISIMVAVATVACGFDWLRNNHQIANFSHLGMTRQFFAVLPVILWTVFAICLYARLKFAFRRSAEWQTTPLTAYTKTIPEFAVESAVALKKELPAATFKVEELIVRDNEVHTSYRPRPVRADFDPFLIMTYKGHELYVEVWNEHKFEGKRIK